MAVASGLWAGQAVGAESAWKDGLNSRTRLTTGSVERDGGHRVYAFVEIEMPKGWKTYWRNPGDAGGLPPRFDWSKSVNLGSAKVLYPAPRRLTDEAGDTIGYKDHVIFPVEIAAAKPDRPIMLSLALSFGICKDICIPSEATHELSIEGWQEAVQSREFEVLERVPRSSGLARPGDPTLKRAALETSGTVPRLVVEVAHANPRDETDVFIEAPDGLYVPMASRVGEPAGGVQRFEAVLGNALEPKDLKGKSLILTLVSGSGSTESVVAID